MQNISKRCIQTEGRHIPHTHIKEEKASDTDRVTYRAQYHKDSAQMHSVTLVKRKCAFYIQEEMLMPDTDMYTLGELYVQFFCFVSNKIYMDYF